MQRGKEDTRDRAGEEREGMKGQNNTEGKRGEIDPGADEGRE